MPSPLECRIFGEAPKPFLPEGPELSLQVFDTLRGGKQPFTPERPGEVGMYVCGMTVQAPPHVGHMRAYVVADVIRRILRARGYRVTLVQNFTDIDDKIIAKANAEGIGYREL